MCYDHNARPPFPPIAGGAAAGEDIVLTAQDGNRFAAYMARAGKANGAQVLIYPDVRGLHPFYKELALRFAEVGISALAMDYFGRTAGLEPRDESFDFRAHVQQMQVPSFFADVAAALDYLRKNSNNQQAFIVGFCMGGTLSLLSSAEDFALAGSIAFYAGLSRTLPGAKGSAVEQAAKIHNPVLGLFGGDDPGIPESAVQQLDAELDKAGVQHEVISYPGAPHSFFDRKYEEFADASADAWKRMLAFINAQSTQA